MQIKWALPLILLALSTGCVTVAEKECRVVDWGELGRTDGANGDEATHLAVHAQACARYNIPPDTLAYNAGREAGLYEYCTPDNALQQGYRGAIYHQVCAGEAGETFVAIYARGRALRLIQDDMQALQNRADAERNAQAQVKEPELREHIDQNLRYFESEMIFMQRQYTQAKFTVDAGFDPPFYDEDRWEEGIPYAKALHQAEKK